MNADRLRDVADAWLRARDRAEVSALAVEHRARHTRAAHRTWGVAGGLEVVALRGRTVLVRPGVAIDPCGRTLVLRAAVRLPDPPAGGRRVVLHAHGPGALVRLTDRPGPAGVPLARVEPGPVVHDGDGDRVWAARPGPALTRAGTLARGGPLGAADGSATTGTGVGWTATVAFGGAPFASPPHVVAMPVGPPPPGVTDGTVEVHAVTGTGFDVTVRHRSVTDPPPVHVTTVDIGWLAVLPADRIVPEETP